MDTQTPKRLVTSIEAYRAAKVAGRVRIIPQSDSFGSIVLSIEQDFTDPFTEEKSINVVSSITSESIRTGRENLQKLMNEGDTNNPQEQGVESLMKHAENLRKQADAAERQAEARKSAFQDRLADMDALLADALAVEEKAKAEYEVKLAATTKAVEKKIVEKEPAEKK
jgi:small-conductance mechanosensitive channel